MIPNRCPNHAKNPEGARDWILRKVLALGLACSLPIVAVGCRSITSQYGIEEKPGPPASPKADEMVTKTDFRRTVDSTQKFNVHLELGRAFEGEGNYDAAI